MNLSGVVFSPVSLQLVLMCDSSMISVFLRRLQKVLLSVYPLLLYCLFVYAEAKAKEKAFYFKYLDFVLLYKQVL